MPYLNESQRRYLPLFTEYVDISTGNVLNNDFAQDALRLRAIGESMTGFKGDMDTQIVPTPFSDFIVKYGFNLAMVDFLYAYLIDGTINPFLINTGMFIVSEFDKTATGRQSDGKLDYLIYRHIAGRSNNGELKLVIPAGVTLNEVKDFLDHNWTPFVAPRQEQYRTAVSAPSGRIRSSDAAFRKRVLDLVAGKLPYAEIAVLVNSEFGSTVTYKNIADLVYREKHKAQ